MALLGQSRDSWPSIAPLGHVELTKIEKLSERKNKNVNENEKQNEKKSDNSFLFSFSFLCSFSFSFSSFFCFHFPFCFCFSILFSLSFSLLFSFLFLFSFSFLFLFFVLCFFLFYFLVFSFKFDYGTSRPPYKFLFNIVAALKACNFIKKKLQHRCFPVNIAKFLRTPVFTKHLRWLLLIRFTKFFKTTPANWA